MELITYPGDCDQWSASQHTGTRHKVVGLLVCDWSTQPSALEQSEDRWHDPLSDWHTESLTGRIQVGIFLEKFSISSQTRKQISTFSLLKMVSIFLFLFSISLFGISSMPAFKIRLYNRLLKIRLSSSSPNDINRPSRATFGQNWPIYGILGPFLTPLGPYRAISVGPDGINRPSWMYPTQIQQRST